MGPCCEYEGFGGKEKKREGDVVVVVEERALVPLSFSSLPPSVDLSFLPEASMRVDSSPALQIFA